MLKYKKRIRLFGELGVYMKFIKENSYDIVKLIINQVGITIFSLVLLFTAQGANLPAVFKPIFSVFSTLFYFALLYTVSWEFGAKDKIRIDAGRYSASKGKGILLGLAANAFNILLGIVSIVSMVIHMMTNAQWLADLFGVANILMRFILAMYIGMIQSMTTALSGNVDFLVESILYLVFPLVAVAVVGFGYFMGAKDLRIFSSTVKNNVKK